MKKNKIDVFYFSLVLPIIFILMVFTYLVAVKISNSNSKVCSYLGRIWLAGTPGDNSSLHGCYTYEELAQKGQL